MCERTLGLLPRPQNVVLEPHISTVVLAEVPVLHGADNEPIVINHGIPVISFEVRVEGAAHPVPRDTLLPAMDTQ